MTGQEYKLVNTSYSDSDLVPRAMILKLFVSVSLYTQKLLVTLGTSPAVQWLRLQLPLQGVRVRSLVGELRSCMPHGAAKKKKKIIGDLKELLSMWMTSFEYLLY